MKFEKFNIRERAVEKEKQNREQAGDGGRIKIFSQPDKKMQNQKKSQGAGNIHGPVETKAGSFQ